MQIVHTPDSRYLMHMEPTREQILQFLDRAMAATQLSASGLARKAGIATTTLTRFIKDEHASMLSMRSLAKIAHAAGTEPIGVPAVIAPAAPRAIRMIDEPASSEAVPLKLAERSERLRSAVAALIGGRDGTDPWVLLTRALEACGYRPGDIVLVDLNQRAEKGHVVCAQVYEWQSGRAETIWRIFEPPYLVAAPLDADLADQLRRPLLVDNDRIIIKGVVTEMLRAR